MIILGLWKYDPETKMLTNKRGDWEFKSSPWILPKEGKDGGYIEDSSGHVLSPKDGATKFDTLVILDSKNASVTDDQNWIRGKTDNQGYFTLQNSRSNRFLIARSTTETVIAGKTITYIYTQ